MTCSSRQRVPFLLGALVLSAGCATVKPPSNGALVPSQYQTRTGPYCVYTNAPMAADAPAIRHLQSLERQLEQALGVRVPPDSEPIEVYILDSPEAFRHFLTFYYPELPSRRAFFLAQGTRRVVYTYQGTRLEEDLRHEATHALLHAAVPDLPLWLDEGLAEYFEVDESREGRNAEHLARLPDDFASGFTPDLKRLEAIKDVRKMTPRDYRESWAWVHYLLNGPPTAKAALLADLADRRGGADEKPLSRRLLAADPEASARLAAHVEATGAADRALMKAKSQPEGEPTVRFQDRPAEPRLNPRRRGPFGRFAALFGF
jgi:Protein of unknown function (DUF1570)